MQATTKTTAGETVTSSERLLLSARDLGTLLGVNKSTVWSWHNSGRIPMPVRIGGATRWRAGEIRAWVAAGCPPREKWKNLENPS